MKFRLAGWALGLASALQFIAPAANAAAPVFTSLYSFSGDSHGAYPGGPLTEGLDGQFYGVTGGDTANGNNGTVFKITSDGALTTLYSLNGSTDGADPNGKLALGPDGNFYGTVYKRGGAGGTGRGTLYRVTPDGVFTTLYVFAGAADGEYPIAGLTLASDGNFYGTSSGWIGWNDGSLFKLSPSGTFTLLHTFTGGADGCMPYTPVTQGANGDFYTTTSGVCGNTATTFVEATPAGSLSTVYTVSSSNVPIGSTVILAKDGNFWGTSEGNYLYPGLVFKMTPAGVITVVHEFQVGTDGDRPSGGLIQASDGNFYGTTELGADSSHPGTVFRITPDGVLTTLYTFSGTDGATPWDGVMQGSDGNLYGTTSSGGEYNYGTIFKLQVPMAPPPPARLTAVSKSAGSITLAWTAANGATGYDVYVSRKPGGESTTPVRKNLTATHVTLAGLTSGVRYFFKVAAVNANGVGLMSPEATATAK